MPTTTTIARSELDQVILTANAGVIGVVFEDDGSVTLTDARFGGNAVTVAKPDAADSVDFPPAAPDAPDFITEASTDHLVEILAAAVEQLRLRGVAAPEAEEPAPVAEPAA